jgi:hypothetical protein
MDKLSTSVKKMDLSFQLIKVMGKWILKQFPCVFLFVSTDISLIYHMIRGQSTIKLYVVYNILEVK